MIVPRIGIARGSVCVQVRSVPWGLIAKDPVHEQTFVVCVLYSSCFCRLIILISFNFWLVVELYLEGLTLQLFCVENLISFENITSSVPHD